MNSSDLADPMIMAIMTSRRTKRANAQNFRKWIRGLSPIQLFETDVCNYSSFKWYCIWMSRSNYHRSFLRRKLGLNYDRNISHKANLAKVTDFNRDFGVTSNE